MFDPLVKLVQVDVRQKWTQHATLRCATERPVKLPVVQVACTEQFSDQPKEPFIVDLIAQQLQEDGVIDGVEVLSNISFNEPPCSRPCMLYLLQCSVAAMVGAKAVGMVAKLRLEVGFEDRADDFLQQLIFP